MAMIVPVLRPFIRALRRPSSLGLSQGEHVSIRILEPRHLSSAWRAPDSKLVLLHSGKALELYSLLLKTFHGFSDVAYTPAEDREWRGLVVRDTRDVDDADHHSVGIENESKPIVADKAEPERLLKELARFLTVSRGD